MSFLLFLLRGLKLYPFNKSKTANLRTSPLVDTSVMRLAHHVTFSMEDVVSFKALLDRILDLDLKKVYLESGSTYHSSIT